MSAQSSREAKAGLFKSVRHIAAARAMLSLTRLDLDYLRHASECVRGDDIATETGPCYYERVDDTAAILGVSPRAVHGAEKRLAAAGLIERTAMANGHRGAKRSSKTGALIWAHGVLLSPLVEREAEIAEMAEKADRLDKAYRAARQSAHQLRARLVEACENAAPIKALMDLRAQGVALLEASPRRIERRQIDLADLNCLCGQLEMMIDALMEAATMASKPSDVISEAVENINEALSYSDASERGFQHKYNTKPQGPSVLSNPRVDNKAEPASRGRSHSSGADAPQCWGKNKSAGSTVKPLIQSPALVQQIASIPLDLALQAASPDFTDAYEAQDAPGWRGLVAAASLLRPHIGVSQDGWAEACDELGREGAALALLIADARRRRGELRAGQGAAGAYLRGMIAKARDGELRIAQSIFGLAGPIRSAPRDPNHAGRAHS